MADILSIISIISFVGFGVFLVVAIVVWFVFKIPYVIGDLSGRNARRSIEEIRRNNEKAGYESNKQNKHMARNVRQMDSKTVIKKESKVYGNMPDYNIDETGLLDERRGEILSVKETSMLNSNENEIEENATTPLIGEETVPLNVIYNIPSKRVGGKEITLIEEILMVHTDEVIT